MNWNLISDGLPPEKQEVLLRWAVPDMPSIFRLGTLLYEPFEGDDPIWKFDLDYGDAGAWVFTNRGDEQPTHWTVLTEPASGTSAGTAETGTGSGQSPQARPDAQTPSRIDGLEPSDV